MKKNLFLTLIFSLFALFVNANTNYHISPEAVPKSAKKYVAKNFPEAYNIRWGFKRKEVLYKSDFKVKGENYRLVFSPVGKLIYFKGAVSSSELPNKVKKYLKKYYSGYQISKIEKTRSFKYISYKVILNGDFYGKTKQKTINIDQKGNLLD